ncbi:hypothetical protein GCM10010256_80340 [Streptomyces coeruleorubidus]|nr:hypothetical protein GCM10010256_80340 [Streptomyces coeruleorubidus]
MPGEASHEGIFGGREDRGNAGLLAADDRGVGASGADLGTGPLGECRSASVWSWCQ